MPNQAEGAASSNYSALLPTINVADGLSRLMNNKKLYFKLLNGFKLKEMSEELINNINDAETDKTIQSAHAIKGVASNLGLTEITSVVTQIEAQAKSGAETKGMLDSLRLAANNTSAAIEKLLNENI